MADPVITPINPINGATAVAKDQPIQFRIDSDSAINLALTVVYVRGDAVYNGGKLADGWAASFSGAVDSLICEVTAPTLERWRAAEVVAVHVLTVDADPDTADARWSFTAIRTLGVRIYPMILGGVRKQDEG